MEVCRGGGGGGGFGDEVGVRTDYGLMRLVVHKVKQCGELCERGRDASDSRSRCEAQADR